MLDDPRINFAISKRGLKPGLDHLGVQVSTEEELAALRSQVAQAEIAALDQENASCCYARSDKYWITDPQGIAWETFHTLGNIPVFGEDTQRDEADNVACCTPMANRSPEKAAAACCSLEDVAGVKTRAACCG
jgi:hypothetical protein